MNREVRFRGKYYSIKYVYFLNIFSFILFVVKEFFGIEFFSVSCCHHGVFFSHHLNITWIFTFHGIGIVLSYLLFGGIFPWIFFVQFSFRIFCYFPNPHGFLTRGFWFVFTNLPVKGKFIHLIQGALYAPLGVPLPSSPLWVCSPQGYITAPIMYIFWILFHSLNL